MKQGRIQRDVYAFMPTSSHLLNDIRIPCVSGQAQQQSQITVSKQYKSKPETVHFTYTSLVMSGTTFRDESIELKTEYRISHLSYALLKILQTDIYELPYFVHSSSSFGIWAHHVYKQIIVGISEVEKKDTPNLVSFRSYSFARNELEP